MSSPIEAVDAAIREVEQARQRTKRGRNRQVRSADELDYLKAVTYTWFRSRREQIANSGASCTEVDATYQVILDATAKSSTRAKYEASFKDAKTALTALRSRIVAAPIVTAVLEPAPDFSPLAADHQMREILERRWSECQRCIAADVHLAATVMMGGLLEALFVARANRMINRTPLFTAKATPKDRSGKSLPLAQWTLQPYLDVAHELGWISGSAKDVGVVLRDYRNYIHPEKERSHGVRLGVHDSTMFWRLTKSLTEQLLSTADR